MPQFFCEHLAIGCEDEASALAHEHLLSKPVLERVDLLADGAMGHAQLGSGRSEARRARRHGESPQSHQRQFACFHSRTPIPDPLPYVTKSHTIVQFIRLKLTKLSPYGDTCRVYMRSRRSSSISTVPS